MSVLKKPRQLGLLLLFTAALLPATAAFAATDLTAQEAFLKAKADNHADHSNHLAPVDKNLEFHGVFYGFIPCADCNGIKTTLSLKQNNLYLLVTQPARESSREYYEKGKYTWDDDKRTVVLTPRKGEPHNYHIEDDGTIIQLGNDGLMMPDKEKYTLRRSDTVKSREVHIH
jgi:hypothetical protein